MNDIIQAKLELLPHAPGVYKMLDKRGQIIYVGKAISLKNRVRQYFQSSKNQAPKVVAMVAHVEDFEILLTASEMEALTLESNLIKRFQPRYNILLKDDKHFPYVRVDLKQDFPRVEVVRRVRTDGARYLGPYLSSVALHEALDVVRGHFPVRHCKKDIAKAIARRERPCLMHHVGKCCAPCSGALTREAYHAVLSEVMDFLDGRTADVIKALTAQMLDASEKLEFERAARLRDSIDAVRHIGDKQTAIASSNVSRDVFACCAHEGELLIFGVFVRGGKVVGTEKFSLTGVFEAGEDTAAEAMGAFLKQYYVEAVDIPPEILLHAPAQEMEEIERWLCGVRKKRVHMLVPQRGEKRDLTELAYRNGMDALLRADTLKKRAWERGEGALAELSGLLGLDALPARMECFDNSHIQGRDTVAAMVVFQDGVAAKSEYRRFRIKTETAGDDYAAMKEALDRRFARAMDDDARFSTLPDLLVLDGGRGQLNAGLEILEKYGLSHIPAVGLAERSGGIYLPDRDEPLMLKSNSAALHLIERLRDEAHRFAISYHRGLRGKSALYSRLNDIPGVGDKRRRALFDAFPTLDAIRAADEDALAAVKGMDKRAAHAVYVHFHPEGAGATGE